MASCPGDGTPRRTGRRWRQVDQRGGEGQRDRDGAQQELVAEQADLPQRRVVGPDGERRAHLAGHDTQPGDRRGLPGQRRLSRRTSSFGPDTSSRRAASRPDRPSADARRSRTAPPVAPADPRRPGRPWPSWSPPDRRAECLSQGLGPVGRGRRYRTACQAGSPPAGAKVTPRCAVRPCPRRAFRYAIDMEAQSSPQKGRQMSTLLRRDPRTMFPELVEWFEEPFLTLRPYLAQPIRIEDFVEDDLYLVRAELAGIDPAKDVEVTVGAGFLTIRAERHDKTEGKHRTEFRYGSFSRSLPLPAPTPTRTTSRRPTITASSPSPSASRSRRRKRSRRSRSSRPSRALRRGPYGTGRAQRDAASVMAPVTAEPDIKEIHGDQSVPSPTLKTAVTPMSAAAGGA